MEKNPQTWVTEGETERERAVLFSVFCVWVSRAGQQHNKGPFTYRA